MIEQKVAKRSACDRCREKRVRCPRTEQSTEPCARCVRASVACVTGSPGLLGRPRKATKENSSRSPWSISGSSPYNNLATQQIAGYVDLAMSGIDPMSTDSPVLWHVPDTPSEILDTPQTADLSESSHGEKQTRQDQLGPWSSDDAAHPYGFSLADQDSALISHATLPELEAIIPQQTLLGGAGTVDMISVDPYFNHLLDTAFPSLPKTPKYDQSAKTLEATVSLSRFIEKMARYVSAIESYNWGARLAIESCMDEMEDPTQNHVAQALISTKEFTDIVQHLNSSFQPCSPSLSASNQAVAPTTSSNPRPKTLSTQTALLVLSGYLQLIQFYDSLFYHSRQIIGAFSSKAIQSIRVKSVVRFGGVSSMQDMAGKSYGKVMIEVLQSHVQDMERQMGLPARYCLSGKNTAPDGVFTNIDLAPLVQVVMAQDDIRLPRTGKLHVESIRENIKGLLAILED